MARGKYRILKDIDGVEYRFFQHGMKVAVDTYREQKLLKDDEKISVAEVFQMIADAVHVSPDAVKNWYGGKNGPADLATIKGIAQALETNYKKLIQPIEELSDGGNTMNAAINERPDEVREVLLNLYSQMIDYVYMYPGSDVYMYVPSQPNLEHPEEYYEEILRSMNRYLDSNALILDDETYNKMHRLLSELRETTDSHPGYYNIAKRWYDYNSLLSYVLPDDEIDNRYWMDPVNPGPLEEKFIEELDIEYTMCYKDLRSPEQIRCLEGAHVVPTYEELWSWEVAKTIKILFRTEFPQYFS